MSNAHTQPDDKILHKIRSLYDTAADENLTPEARESYRLKADELMAKYAIDAALLDASRPPEDRTKIRSMEWTVAGKFLPLRSSLTWAVARGTGCRAIRTYKARGAKHHKFTVIGFEPDVAAFEFMYTLLEGQLLHEMIRAGHADEKWWQGMAPAQVSSYRMNFGKGWIYRVEDRLKEARDNAIRNSNRERPGQTSAALVLVDRDKLVEDALKAAFPRITHTRQHVSNGAAHAAGQRAAERANIGNKAAGPGSRGAIGR